MKNTKAMATVGIHEKSLEILEDFIDKNTKIVVGTAGNGNFENLLIEKYGADPKNITPMDLDEKNYNFEPCKKNFVKADMNFLFEKLKSESFDVAICIETIEHISNQENVINEYARILKNNGYLIITTPNCESFATRLFYLFKGIFPAFQNIHFEGTRHIVPFFSWTLDYFTRRNELKIVKYDSHSFHFWIIPYFLKIKIPFKSKLFAETNIWLLQKQK